MAGLSRSPTGWSASSRRDRHRPQRQDRPPGPDRQPCPLTSDRGGEQELLAKSATSRRSQAFEAQMNGMKTLRAGFTTVRNLGDDGGMTLACATRSSAAGSRARGSSTPPARSRPPAAIWTAASALNDELVAHLPDPENLCDSVESCRRVVRRQIDRGADVIKFATTGGVNSGTGLATRMFEDEAKALVETAHVYGRKVAVHAHGADGIKLALARRRGLDRARHGDGRRDRPG